VACRQSRPGARHSRTAVVGSAGMDGSQPDKIAPRDGAEMVAHWNQQLHDLGYEKSSATSSRPCPLRARSGPQVQQTGPDSVISQAPPPAVITKPGPAAASPSVAFVNNETNGAECLKRLRSSLDFGRSSAAGLPCSSNRANLLTVRLLASDR
jgi:hypothetical protein